MEIFVINLDRRTDRLDYMTKMLGDLGLSFERVPAIDGRNIKAWKHVHLWKTALYHDFQMPTAGTIACYLSHRRVWEEIVSRNLTQAIVFEDDVIPVDFDPAILNVNLADLGLDQLRLEEWDWQDPGRVSIRPFELPLLGRHAIGLSTAGTGCYLVSRQGAEKFLRAGRFWFTVDHFDIWERVFGIRTAVLRPKMFNQSNSASDIKTQRLPTELLPTILKDFILGPRPGLTAGLRRLLRWVKGAVADVTIHVLYVVGYPIRKLFLFCVTRQQHVDANPALPSNGTING